MGDVSPPNFHMGGLNLLGDVSPHRGNFSCYQNPFCTRVHSIAVIFIFFVFLPRVFNIELVFSQIFVALLPYIAKFIDE